MATNWAIEGKIWLSKLEDLLDDLCDSFEKGAFIFSTRMDDFDVVI